MTTPALARTALARLRNAAIRIEATPSELSHVEANAAEVLAAIDAWERATIPTPNVKDECGPFCRCRRCE